MYPRNPGSGLAFRGYQWEGGGRARSRLARGLAFKGVGGARPAHLCLLLSAFKGLVQTQVALGVGVEAGHTRDFFDMLLGAGGSVNDNGDSDNFSPRITEGFNGSKG